MLHDGPASPGNMNGPLTHQPHQLSIEQLREMAARQQQQIEEQQQLLVAKEQRLKYLKQQEYQQHQMASEYEKLRRLRDKVEAQELKLRKLRALRGQTDNMNKTNGHNNPASLSSDLESIRRLFNEKEKELALAVAKVEDLTRQLEELRTGKLNYNYPPQVVELEKLRRELAYRRQLNEQQNNMISQQRAQLSLGQEEMARIDRRIAELQDRLTRKRMMNQQLANQINAATSAKQAQLRAIQAGLANKNNNNNNSNANMNNINMNKSNKPVSTVEPFQRTIPTASNVTGQLHHYHHHNSSAGDNNNQLLHLSADDLKPAAANLSNSNSSGNSGSGVGGSLILSEDGSNNNAGNKNVDPKYQTLPYNTKFGQGVVSTMTTTTTSSSSVGGNSGLGNNNSNLNFGPPSGSSTASSTNATMQQKAQKIEQLKLEKENNNIGFSEGLPRPPPPVYGGTDYPSGDGVGVVAPIPHSQQSEAAGHGQSAKPVSSVAPIAVGFSNANLSYANAGMGNNSIDSMGRGGGSVSPTKLRPALPPKPYSSTGGGQRFLHLQSEGGLQHRPSPVHGEEGTSVDDEELPPPPPPTSEPPADSPVPSPSDATSQTSSDVVGRGQHNLNDSDMSVSVMAPDGQMDHPTGAGLHVTTAAAGNNPNNVHVSINRRIEMPPAFHFPEDEAPPSDLIPGGTGVGSLLVDYTPNGGGTGSQSGPMLPRDVTDNAAMFPMVNQIYKEFQDLGFEEKEQLFSSSSSRSPLVDESDEYSPDCAVPEFESDPSSGPTETGVKSIIKQAKKGNLKITGKTRHNRKVSFDPLALLLDASLEGELDLVRKTALEVPDTSAANDEGITALHNAICAGHLDIVKFLVMFGCDVNAQDSDGWTPLHCAASCNNLAMVKFLVEHGACIFATTLSDHETAAEKCEEDEEGFDGCSEYLYHIQEKLGIMNDGVIYTLYRYDANNPDELTFGENERLVVVRKGDEVERDWWWASRRVEGGGGGEEAARGLLEGYIPRNLVGLYPRVSPGANQPMEE